MAIVPRHIGGFLPKILLFLASTKQNKHCIAVGMICQDKAAVARENSSWVFRILLELVRALQHRPAAGDARSFGGWHASRTMTSDFIAVRCLPRAMCSGWTPTW
jgi:hypothetical protein